jgi:hypothetical protein
MKKTYWLAVYLAPLGLMLMPAGCEKEDPEHLANVARKVASRAEPLVETVDSEWAQRFRTSPQAPPVPAALPIAELGVEARVSSRLRWEKSLSGVSIQVTASEGVIELKGKVANVAQKKRAVELAESTTGVDKVTESLEVDEQSP